MDLNTACLRLHLPIFEMGMIEALEGLSETVHTKCSQQHLTATSTQRLIVAELSPCSFCDELYLAVEVFLKQNEPSLNGRGFCVKMPVK